MFVLVNERGQWRRARLVNADRKVTAIQITTHYNSGMKKSISEHTTCQTSKWIGYSSRRLIKNISNKSLIKCSLSVYHMIHTVRTTIHWAVARFVFLVLYTLSSKDLI